MLIQKPQIDTDKLKVGTGLYIRKSRTRQWSVGVVVKSGPLGIKVYYYDIYDKHFTEMDVPVDSITRGNVYIAPIPEYSKDSLGVLGDLVERK